MDQFFSDSVDQYIVETFSPEAGGEIRASLMVFDAFDYQTFDNYVADVLYGFGDETAADIQEQFVALVNQHIDNLLGQHCIKLVPETTLRYKNQILGVLYRLQHLEDPIPVLRILEGSRSPEEQFALIISTYSELSETDVLESLEDLDEAMLEGLQGFLYHQEEAEKEDSVDVSKTKLIQNLRDFFQVTGTDNLGHNMMSTGIKVGYSLSLYYPYVKNSIVTEDDAVTAKNILSLFYLAEDTWLDPLKTYRHLSEQLLGKAERIMRIETHLGKMVSDLSQYQKAKDDARKVSLVQHPA